MKRFALSVMMTAVLALSAYTWSGAQGPEGRRGPGRPGGPGFGRGGFVELRGVDLTDQQREEIRAIRDAARPADAGPPADMSLRRQLQAEVFADAPDTAKIAALQDQLVKAQAERLAKEIATDQKIASVLTAEQRTAIRERLAKQPERGAAGDRRDRGPRGSGPHARP